MAFKNQRKIIFFLAFTFVCFGLLAFAATVYSDDESRGEKDPKDHKANIRVLLQKNNDLLAVLTGRTTGFLPELVSLPPLQPAPSCDIPDLKSYSKSDKKNGGLFACGEDEYAGACKDAKKAHREACQAWCKKGAKPDAAACPGTSNPAADAFDATKHCKDLDPTEEGKKLEVTCTVEGPCTCDP